MSLVIIYMMIAPDYIDFSLSNKCPSDIESLVYYPGASSGFDYVTPKSLQKSAEINCLAAE